MTGLNEYITRNTGDGKPIDPADLDRIMQELANPPPHPRDPEGRLILNDDEAASLSDRGVVMIHDAGKMTVLYNEKIRGTAYEEIVARIIDKDNQ